jgi:hypothetical protein
LTWRNKKSAKKKRNGKQYVSYAQPQVDEAGLRQPRSSPESQGIGSTQQYTQQTQPHNKMLTKGIPLTAWQKGEVSSYTMREEYEEAMPAS